MVKEIKDFFELSQALGGEPCEYQELLEMAAQLPTPTYVEDTEAGRKELAKIFHLSRRYFPVVNPYAEKRVAKKKQGLAVDSSRELSHRPISYAKMSELSFVAGVGVSTDSFNKGGKGDHFSDGTLFKLRVLRWLRHPYGHRALDTDEIIAVLTEQETVESLTKFARLLHRFSAMGYDVSALETLELTKQDRIRGTKFEEALRLIELGAVVDLKAIDRKTGRPRVVTVREAKIASVETQKSEDSQSSAKKIIPSKRRRSRA